MEEIWEEIPELKGYYWASSLGRIKSIARTVLRKGKELKIPETILRPAKNKRGYLDVAICIDGIPKTAKVHRLVATAFHPNPKEKPDVNHINGIPWDNRPDNLEWVTESENILHSYRVLNRKGISLSGEKNGCAKITPIHVRTIRELYKTGKYSQQQLASIFSMERSTIGKIAQKKLWAHID